MAVDEFGREIPGHRDRDRDRDRDGGASSKEYYGPSSPRQDDPHDHGGHGGGVEGSSSHSKDHHHHRRSRSPSPPATATATAPSSSHRHSSYPRQPRSRGRSSSSRNHRDDRDRDRDRDRGDDRYGGGSSSHHHHGHGHGNHHHHGQQQSSYPYPKRYHSNRRHLDFANHSNHNNRHYSGGRHSHSHRSRGAAAAERYASKPMLCEYLWKQQQQQQQQQQKETKDEDTDNHDTTVSTNEQKDTDATTNVQDPQSQETNETTTYQQEENVQEQDNLTTIPSTSKDTSNTDDYDTYRHGYCLNYVRSFFNHHLDDSWFRRRYSPLGRTRAALEERERASHEATCLQNEIQASLESFQSATTITSKDNVCGFVRRARLGHGHKEPLMFYSSNPRPKRKYSEGGTTMTTTTTTTATPSTPLQQLTGDNVIPQSHLFGKMDCLMTVQDIPPFVTDEQLGHALMDHCDVAVTGIGIQIYSSQVESPSSSSSHYYPNYLDRDAFVFVESPDIKKNLLTNLTTRNAEKRGNSSSAKQQHDNNDTGTSHVPRKEDIIRIPRKLDLVVECSDPYGRFEIDADGKGGAPPDSDEEDEDDHNDEKKGISSKDHTTALPRSTKSVAHRKCTVTVVTEPPDQKITVLSASVSSKSRIPQDKEAAMTIARALDVAHGVPRGVRLDDLVETLFPTTTTSSSPSKKGNEQDDDNEKVQEQEVEQKVEDMLDVSIAYLRRVHLFSFYQGCTKASGGIGEVLSGKHASATIHLRLENADEILRKAKEEADEMYGDLVVVEKKQETPTNMEEDENNNTNKDENDNHADNPNGEDTAMKEEDTNGTTTANTNMEDNKESLEQQKQQQQQQQQPSTDLLVRRLDESIAKATNEGREWVARAGMYVIDQEIDTAAADIEHKEDSIKRMWIDNHGSVDMDGRARCTFHFCRKLFKDESFLKKHLMKKHGEFLRAEIAKVHDTYMMKAWDLEVHRPVPPIMVDCGTNFGLVPSVVIGADQPIAIDPEPDLWAKEEEQRKRRTEQQQQHNNNNNNDDRYNNTNTSRDHRRSFDGGHEDGALSTPMDGGGGRNSNRGGGGGKEFVDVDDVQVEKVEMKFEDVVMIPQVETAKKSSTKKKKKKKRKLL